MEKIDRFRGCLLGLACGDAVGTTLEFKTPGAFTPITDMTGGGPFQLNAGEWTDDTSMALCLAFSLIERRGFEPRDQMDKYVSWWKEGYLSSTGACFDIGNTVRAALSRYVETGDPIAGSTEERAAGNGSIMRLAPIPMFYAGDFAEVIAKSGESSATTHGAQMCVDACRYFGFLVAAALSGIDKQRLLSASFINETILKYFQQNPLCEPIALIANGSFKRKAPPEIKGTGFVVESLEAALWAFSESTSFREGCLLAANLGDDADTTAAIYGQIAGAHYGISDIPHEWVRKLSQLELIEKTATQLFELNQSCR